MKAAILVWVVSFRQYKLSVIRDNMPFDEKGMLCNWKPANVLSSDYNFSTVVVKFKHSFLCRTTDVLMSGLKNIPLGPKRCMFTLARNCRLLHQSIILSFHVVHSFKEMRRSHFRKLITTCSVSSLLSYISFLILQRAECVCNESGSDWTSDGEAIESN